MVNLTPEEAALPLKADATRINYEGQFANESLESVTSRLTPGAVE